MYVCACVCVCACMCELQSLTGSPAWMLACVGAVHTSMSPRMEIIKATGLFFAPFRYFDDLVFALLSSVLTTQVTFTAVRESYDEKVNSKSEVIHEILYLVARLGDCY